MSLATIPQTSTSAPSWMRRRWTDEEFDRMVEVGLIREGSSTFLWDGEIIEPMSEDNPHCNAVANLRDLLSVRLPKAEWTINQDFSVQLAPGYRPQPDISIVRGPRSAYRVRRQRPTARDAVLLVEISDTTYADDRGEFLRKYAASGIPQYWIVNIAARRIEVYSEPDAESLGYRVRKDYALDSRVPLVLNLDGALSEFEPISVHDVLQDSLEDA